MRLVDAAVGSVVSLVGQEAFHAQKVMRLREGQSLDLVDGRGLRVAATVRAGGPHGFQAEVTAALQEAEASPSLILVQALAKGGRDEQAIETATEVGVDKVVPWQAKRCVARWDGKKSATGVQRWQRVLDAAAKQARRAWVPQVSPAVTTAQLVQKIRGMVEGGALVLVAHESGLDTFSRVMETQSSLRDLPSIVVVVGPEGGITDDELVSFEEAGAVIVRMGNNVMRSSTAGPAALVALNVEMERW